MSKKFNPNNLPSWLKFKDGTRRIVRNLESVKNRLEKGEYEKAKNKPYYKK